MVTSLIKKETELTEDTQADRLRSELKTDGREPSQILEGVLVWL